jgi:POT family proton-dependent oligopeptide transporter
MGINLGGFLAPLVCGTLGEVYGWHWGFAAAGIGMAVGLVVYISCLKLLPPEPKRLTRDESRSIGGTLIDRSKLRTLFLIIAMVVLFRIGYEQSGNVIALWVADRTDRTTLLLGSSALIPATWFQSINPLLIIVLTPFIIRMWKARGQVESVPHLLRRMSFGCVLAGLAMALMVVAATASGPEGLRVSYWWTVGYFVLLTLGELFVIPVGLTLVETLSPAAFAATAMGGWYIAKFLGSLMAGIMGAYWLKVPPTAFFALGMVSPLLAALCLYLMSRMAPRAQS